MRVTPGVFIIANGVAMGSLGSRVPTGTPVTGAVRHIVARTDLDEGTMLFGLGLPWFQGVCRYSSSRCSGVNSDGVVYSLNICLNIESVSV